MGSQPPTCNKPAVFSPSRSRQQKHKHAQADLADLADLADPSRSKQKHAQADVITSSDCSSVLPKGEITRGKGRIVCKLPLRYRSSIRIMVRGEAQAKPKVTKVRKSSRTAEVGGEKGAKMSIVRAQIRLPKELSEKMPSAPTTPVPLK